MEGDVYIVFVFVCVCMAGCLSVGLMVMIVNNSGGSCIEKVMKNASIYSLLYIYSTLTPRLKCPAARRNLSLNLR